MHQPNDEEPFGPKGQILPAACAWCWHFAPDLTDQAGFGFCSFKEDTASTRNPRVTKGRHRVTETGGLEVSPDALCDRFNPGPPTKFPRPK